MPVRAHSKASRFSSSPLAPTLQRHVLRDKHDEVGCLIVAEKSQALQRCVMILRSRDSEEYVVASTGLLSTTPNKGDRPCTPDLVLLSRPRLRSVRRRPFSRRVMEMAAPLTPEVSTEVAWAVEVPGRADRRGNTIRGGARFDWR
jgi:hypothetical protein